MGRLLYALLTALLLAGAALAGDAPQRVRPPAVAGSWYPAEPAALGDYLDHLLAAARPAPGSDQGATLRALIVPHAAYRFSGATAAAGYRLMRGRHLRRVIVLGPAHRSGFRGLSIAPVDAYRTPLGTIPLDTAAIARLRQDPLVHAVPAAHRQEHSIEMQLPLLQRALAPGWRLLPILVGRMEDGDHARAAALLRPLLDDDTLLVVSSDFTHYGAAYRYRPFPLDAHTPQRIAALDEGAVNLILARDAAGFLDYRARTGITICGYHPIAILLHLLPAGARGQVVAHTTSGALTGSYRQSVSYWTIAFRSPRPLAAADDDPPADPPGATLDETDWRLLARIAALGVRHAVTGRSEPDDDPAYRALVAHLPERLRQPAGAFVTLWEDGRLRGCIGYLPPIQPLYHAVYRAARNAARRPPLPARVRRRTAPPQPRHQRPLPAPPRRLPPRHPPGHRRHPPRSRGTPRRLPARSRHRHGLGPPPDPHPPRPQGRPPRRRLAARRRPPVRIHHPGTTLRGRVRGGGGEYGGWGVSAPISDLSGV